MMTVFVLFLTFLSIFFESGFAQTNCSRIFHSAIINNQTLYIDGGDMHTVWPNRTITTAAIHDLETIDLSRSWANSDDDLFTSIPKPWNESNPANYPPWLDEGTSWSNGGNLYFYGGYRSGWGGPPVPPLATWRYEIASDNWTRDGFSGVPLVRLAQGESTQSSVDKKAYYLSGTLVPAGNPSFDGTAGADTYMAPGLISLDMNTLEWTNVSTTDMNDFGTMGDGYVSIIESVGDQGLLVAFGGYTYPVGEKFSYLAGRQTNTTNQNSMEFVRVYDIAKEEWYTQQTSGDIPQWRMSGCTVTTAAQDLSSYSIYVFGGMAPTTEKSDGDVYVLSLPSFKWIRVSENNIIRIKHKCQLAKKHIMLTIGGITPVTNDEYIPRPQNCDSATFANGIGIFNLNTASWNTNYDASDNSNYMIPTKVSNVIGGGETGGATLTEPENKFNSTQLAALFKTRNVRSTSSAAVATSASAPAATNSTGHGVSGGTVAGATVGSVAGACILLGLAFIFLRRRKAKQDNPSSMDAPYETPKTVQTSPTELQGEGYSTPVIYELGNDSDIQKVEMPTGE